MRMFICDDEELITTQLKSYIQDFFTEKMLNIPEIIVYHSGEELLEDSSEKDIVFLDIEMFGLDGIFVGRKLKEDNPNTIIFIVTSYSEYLDDAMRFHVFRYLSKPLNPQRLFQNLTDALQLYTSINTQLILREENIPTLRMLISYI